MTNTFLRCGEQFRRRYIEGEITPPGIAARTGSGTHKAAEINHIQKLESGFDLPLDVIQDAARDEYVRLVRDRGVFIPRQDVPAKNKLLAEGLDRTVRLAKLYAEKVAPEVKPKAVEVTLYHEVPGLDIPLRGQLDLLDENNIYRDLKTSGKAGSQSTADNSLQLTFYWGLARANDFPVDRLALDFLVDTGEKSYHRQFSTYRMPGDFDALIQRIKMILQSIKAGLFQPCDPTSWACNERW